MSPRSPLALFLVLLAVACTVTPPLQTPSIGGGSTLHADAVPGAMPGATAIDPVEEAAFLAAALADAMPQRIAPEPLVDAAWVARTRQALAEASVTIDHPQLLVVVDRAPAVQQLRIILAQPGSRPWAVIGGSKVSTGQAGRRGYFITPTGVFQHSADILDYRALGTFNENHIRGLGTKGMRVWDFGWTSADEGWRADGTAGLPQRVNQGQIRLEMHATDPDYLEPRLGRPASKGCVRVPAAMNRFLDHHGVLDAAYEREAITDPRYAALLPADRQPSPLAGTLLVIIDSSGTPGETVGLDR